MRRIFFRVGTVLRLATGMMLVVLGVLNVALIVAILIGQREIRLAQGRYGAGGSAAFVGVDANGGLINVASEGAGTIVWFGSDQCPYCKSDPEMPRLVAALQKKGWQVIVLLPSYDQLFVPGELRLSNVQMVAFVGGEWLKQFPLVVTPTFLMFDDEQRLVWHKRGQLTSSDAIHALRVAGINAFELAKESSSNDDAARAPK